MKEYPYGMTEEEYNTSVEEEFDDLAQKNAALRARANSDLEVIKSQSATMKRLREERDDAIQQMNVLLDKVETLTAYNENYKEVLERITTQLLVRGKIIQLAEEALAWRYK